MQENNKSKCPHCGKEYSKMGIGSHIWRMHTDKGMKYTKDTTKKRLNDMAVAKEKLGGGQNHYTKAKRLGLEKPKLTKTQMKNRMKQLSDANKRRWANPENHIKQSLAMKKAVRENPDSYSKNNVCGRVKLYDYKGIKVKGTWELKVAKWLDKQK